MLTQTCCWDPLLGPTARTRFSVLRPTEPAARTRWTRCSDPLCVCVSRSEVLKRVCVCVELSVVCVSRSAVRMCVALSGRAQRRLCVLRSAAIVCLAL